MDKINELINFLNQYFVETKYFKDFHEEMGIRVTCRLIIEGIVRNLYDKKPTEYFDGLIEMVYFDNINDNLHYDNTKSPSQPKDIWRLFSNIIKTLMKNEKFTILFNGVTLFLEDEDDITFEKIESQAKEYKFIVMREIKNFYNNDYDLYEVAYYERGYNQNRLKSILVKKEVKLFSNLTYTCILDEVSLVHNQNELKKIFSIAESIELIDDFEIQTSEILHANVINLVNEFYSHYKIPFLTYLKSKQRNNILEGDIFYNRLKDIYREADKIHEKVIVDSFLFFKFRHKDMYKSLYGTYNPMQFEFWTKNPQKASFNMEELLFFEKLLKESSPTILSNSYFHSKINRCIMEKLISENNYILEDKYLDYAKVLSQEKFNNNHDKYKLKIIDENTYAMNYYKVVSQWLSKKIKQIDRIGNFSKVGSNDLDRIYNSKFSLLSGPPGSGKTKIIKELIKILNRDNDSTMFLGPTWRSALVFDDNINGSKGTVQNYFGPSTFKKNFAELRDNYDNLIIDEISMLDDTHWYLIAKFVKNNFKRVIISGDLNQLSPLHSIGILNHIDLDGPNHVRLKKTTRQKGELANVISDFLDNGKFTNHHYIKNIIIIYNSIADLYNKLKDYGNYKIITPFNNGYYGRNVINSLFSRKANNTFDVDDVVTIDDPEYGEELKRIIYWAAEFKIKEIKKDCIIFDKKMSSKKFKSEFINRDYQWGWEDFGNLTFFFDEKVGLTNTYCPFSLNNSITTHQAQGSTIDKVVYIIPKDSNIPKDNIYTAISRVKGNSLRNLKVFVHADDYWKICIDEKS